MFHAETDETNPGVDRLVKVERAGDRQMGLDVPESGALKSRFNLAAWLTTKIVIVPYTDR